MLPEDFDESKNWPDPSIYKYDVLEVTKSYVIRQYDDEYKSKRKVFRDGNGKICKKVICVTDKPNCLSLAEDGIHCRKHKLNQGKLA